VVHRKGKRLSAAAEAFREFLLSEARQMVGGEHDRPAAKHSPRTRRK
jgi:hypothetical protein